MGFDSRPPHTERSHPLVIAKEHISSPLVPYNANALWAQGPHLPLLCVSHKAQHRALHLKEIQ